MNELNLNHLSYFSLLSHFLAQTLKYLYLIFSPPELASLDEYLFTTEGHLMSYPISFENA